MTTLPHLSIVICTYDRYDRIGEALTALLADPGLEPGRHEVIVVDNTPAAKRRAIGIEAPGLLRVEPCDILGLSNARNHGIAAAKAPVICFLDDDAYVHPGWCRAVERAFQEQPGAMVVGGKVLPRYDSPERPAWYDDTLSGYLSCIDWGSHGRFLRRGEWIVGANMAWRREVFDRFGGFDPALGRKGAATLISNDETELLERVGIGSIWYEPAMLAEHLVAVERMTLAFFRTRVFWQAASDMVAGIAATEAKRLQEEFADITLRLPAEARNLRAFTHDPLDKDQFALQLRAIYIATVMMGTATAPRR